MDSIQSERIHISGMACVNCQTKIENSLRKCHGVISANASFSGGYADVSYDAGIVSKQEIRNVIERVGYSVSPKQPEANSGAGNVGRIIGFAVIIAVLYFCFSRLNLTSSLPLAKAGMGYGMLLLIGLLTSVHCIAMCGGINLTQCIPQTGGSTFRASALYNLGRVASYTAVGFIVGGIGSVITPNGMFKGAIQIAAGVFMVIMGINMLGLFPRLRKFTPRMPRSIALRINAEKGKSSSPLVIGLLNGLMPCGPLQAMQLYALSTGSPMQGAVSMFIFSLGTVPLMFGLGAASSFLSKKFAKRAMAVGAVFVTVLGLTMLTQGTALSGFSLNGSFDSSGTVAEAAYSTPAETAPLPAADNVTLISSTLKPGSYPKITVQAGIPVKWTIYAPNGSINGCNKALYIAEYGIEHSFNYGENVIEFVPENTGVFQYTCWMGMIRSTITVTENNETGSANPL